VASVPDHVRHLARLALARRFFWDFCQVMYPQHYRTDRPHLERICTEMQDFIESDDQVLILNAPPRHYKSFSATAFCQWAIGKWPTKKIMSGSYNETLSETFSKAVRNAIDTEKVDPSKIVYSDIFPGIRIKRGDGAVNRWALEGQHATYLATSPTGTATGFGCDLMIIDDLIKSALEANNASVLEKHWQWFTDTMLSRLEEGGKIIIVMTRWHSLDLAGRALTHFAALGWKIRHVSFKALQDDGTMLCEELLSRKSYEDKTKTMGADIASANYQQIPIDIKGKLYATFKTYDKVPSDQKGNSLLTGIYCYTDTADEGEDWLCQIIFGAYHHETYVLDVYYTKAPMETTEPECARRLTSHKVTMCRIESNNGGRGFARSVRQHLEKLKNYLTVVKWFHQGNNKKARILSNATWVMEHIYFPVNWRDRWPEYYEAMTTYQREGKNSHDDAPDATTGVAETVIKLGL
jgi:phage uncharacterized protein (putative large terminase), C-terminal domain